MFSSVLTVKDDHDGATGSEFLSPTPGSPAPSAHQTLLTDNGLLDVLPRWGQHLEFGSVKLGA